MLRCPAISTAANRWQRSLLGALTERGLRIDAIGHRPERLWPKGPPRVAGDRATSEGAAISQPLVPYWNLPGYRTASLARSYLRRLAHEWRDAKRPDCVLMYNFEPYAERIKSAADAMGIPCIPVIADIASDDAAERRLEAALGKGGSVVFLSWDAHCRWQRKQFRSLHLDGGVQRRASGPLSATPENKVVFYSGSLDRYGGIGALLAAFSLIVDPSVRLWICGKGPTTGIQRAAARDPRIVFFGCVPEHELVAISRQAKLMVNPRPTGLVDSNNNFPSKVLEYLSFDVPIVSTWTGGLSPEYRELLVVSADDSPAALAASIRRVLDWSGDERAAFVARVSELSARRKSWAHQAEQLAAFMEPLCGVESAAP